VLNLDPGKLLIVAVVAIIILGPDKLPNLVKQVGGAWQTFNQFRARMEAEMRSNLPDLPSTSHLAALAKSPTALLDHFSNMSPETAGAEKQSDLAGIWAAAEEATSIPSAKPAISDVGVDQRQRNVAKSNSAQLNIAGDASLN
jgi:Sec-independent protein translocase protein TatA